MKSGAETSTSGDDCSCLCHQGQTMPHPIPCCTPCEQCGVLVPYGIATHICSGDQSETRPLRDPDIPLVHGLTRYDSAFVGLVVVALMGLCVFSGAGTPLFVGAIAVGAGLGVLMLRLRKNKHPSLKANEPSE